MPERPTLKTERLILRPFRMDDAEDVARLCNDRAIAATTLLIPHPYSAGDAEDWIAGHQDRCDSGRGVDFAVTAKDGGELVGAVGLGIDKEHDRAEIGYWIGVPYWGRGYATEAGAAVLRWALEVRGLERVFAYHFASNPASGRVLEKIGMRREGVSRSHLKKWGERHDCVLYGIVRGDDPGVRAATKGDRR